MVNRFLSSMGILLDNLGVKSLRTNDRKRMAREAMKKLVEGGW